MKNRLLTALAGWLMLLAGTAAAGDESVMATAYGTVNVRSGPGAQYDIVGQLAAGDRVPIEGRSADGDWLQILLTLEDAGWVAAFAVLIDGSILELPVVGIDRDDDASAPAAITVYGRVNVRSGPGMDYPITGELSEGDTLAVIGRDGLENNWLYIQFEDAQGWVAFFTVTVEGSLEALPLLAIDGSGETVVPESSVTRARFNVRLRTTAALDSAALGIVPFDSIVTPLARTEPGDWLYVIHQQMAGWGLARLFDISDEQLELLPVYQPAAATAPAGTATPAQPGG